MSTNWSDQTYQCRGGFSRRRFLGVGASSLGGFLFADGLRADEASTPKAPFKTAGLSVAEFEKLHHGLKLPNKGVWAIPWKVSITEARRLAAKEKKPVFLWVNTGHPLGVC
jgi:hypothetical protein